MIITYLLKELNLTPIRVATSENDCSYTIKLVFAYDEMYFFIVIGYMKYYPEYFSDGGTIVRSKYLSLVNTKPLKKLYLNDLRRQLKDCLGIGTIQDGYRVLIVDNNPTLFLKAKNLKLRISLKNASSYLNEWLYETCYSIIHTEPSTSTLLKVALLDLQIPRFEIAYYHKLEDIRTKIKTYLTNLGIHRDIRLEEVKFILETHNQFFRNL